MENTTEHVDCIFCPGNRFAPYKSENGYTAVRCNQCGLVYTNPRPSIAKMKELYETHETGVDLFAHIHSRDSKCVQARKALKIIREFCPRGHILEVGSAAGYFLYEAKKQGYEVSGIDITKQFVAFSQAALSIPVFEGVLADAPFAQNTFDVIYLRNVLSHLASPIEEFKIMHRFLKPGGFVVLETGNVAEMSPQRCGELELPEHLYHFSENTIKKLFAATGFDSVKTHRYTLLSRLPLVEMIENKATRLFRSRRPATVKVSRRKQEEEIRVMPPPSIPKQINAHVAAFIRYDVGAFIARPGTRCTLIMIGQKPKRVAP